MLASTSLCLIDMLLPPPRMTSVTVNIAGPDKAIIATTTLIINITLFLRFILKGLRGARWLPHQAVNLSKRFSYFCIFLRRPTNPNNPEPNRYAAAGIGVGVAATSPACTAMALKYGLDSTITFWRPWLVLKSHASPGTAEDAVTDQ